MQCDVTDEGQVDAAFAEIEADHGPISVVVCNAGFARLDVAVRAKSADFRDVIDANLTGAFLCARAATMGMLRRRSGRIIFISSVAALYGIPGYASYSASKAALHSLTQGARIVLAPRGVAVLGVYPGPVDTEMSRSIQIEKASAQDVAESILDGVEAGNDDIFPDPFAAAFGEYFQSSPKGSERQVAAMMSGAAAA